MKYINWKQYNALQNNDSLDIIIHAKNPYVLCVSISRSCWVLLLIYDIVLKVKLCFSLFFPLWVSKTCFFTSKYHGKKRVPSKTLQPCPNVLKFSTEHGSDTAMLSAKFQDNSIISVDVRDGWDFMKFESKMCFGQISSIAEHPCLLYINRPSAGMMIPMILLMPLSFERI